MPRFLLSVHVPATDAPGGPAGDVDPAQMMERIEDLERRMRDDDALVSSVRLGGPDEAAVVDASTSDGAEPTVTDGPYLEAKEIIGGFYVVQAASRDAAIGWAAETSRAVGLPIEVRPFLDHRDE